MCRHQILTKKRYLKPTNYESKPKPLTSIKAWMS